MFPLFSFYSVSLDTIFLYTFFSWIKTTTAFTFAILTRLVSINAEDTFSFPMFHTFIVKKEKKKKSLKLKRIWPVGRSPGPLPVIVQSVPTHVGTGNQQ